MANQASALRRNKIILEAYGYGFAPTIHGFRLGNGDLFHSLLLWDEAIGQLSLDGYSYEFISCEDQSESA